MIQWNENHHGWKGDNLTYNGLLDWVRRHIPKSKVCQRCGVTGKLWLSNITGIYNREFENWNYLCLSCHFEVCGTKLRIDMSNRVCSKCGRKWTALTTNNRPIWCYDKQTGMIVCKTCYDRVNREEKKKMIETIRNSISPDQYDKFDYIKRHSSIQMKRDLVSGNTTIDEAYNKLRNE